MKPALRATAWAIAKMSRSAEGMLLYSLTPDWKR